MSPEFIRRGRGKDPKPFNPDDTAIRLPTCPDCDGRGWFLINPFRTGGRNGAGDLGNMTQCLTCLDAHAFYTEHGHLPAELVKESEATQ